MGALGFAPSFYDSNPNSTCCKVAESGLEQWFHKNCTMSTPPGQITPLISTNLVLCNSAVDWAIWLQSYAHLPRNKFLWIPEAPIGSGRHGCYCKYTRKRGQLSWNTLINLVCRSQNWGPTFISALGRPCEMCPFCEQCCLSANPVPEHSTERVILLPRQQAYLLAGEKQNGRDHCDCKGYKRSKFKVYLGAPQGTFTSLTNLPFWFEFSHGGTLPD